MVVVPFQVYEITGSTLAVGLLGLVELMPVFVFPIVGGAFADALERRRLTITTHAILAVMSVLMAVNASSTSRCSGRSTCSPSSPPACTRSTGRRSTHGRRGCSTTSCCRRRTPWNPGSASLDSMLGPVAAGILLATIAPGGAFVFDAVTFLVVIAQIARMSRHRRRATRPR